MPKATVALGDTSLVPELDSIYLAYAGVSPVTQPVRAAVEAVLTDFARRGRAAILEWIKQRERLREQFAAFLGTQPSQLAFTTGTTRGIMDLGLSLKWEPGDVIVVFDGEFPANVTPWQSLQQLYAVRVEILPRPDPSNGEDALLGPLESALRKGVRLVALSAVQFQTGLRAPLRKIAELCHHFGAELSVDAIQACGVLPLDVTETQLDYLVTGGHKWMMGMDGAGVIYVHPERARALKPSTAGWLSVKDGTRFLFEGPGELRYDRELVSAPRFLESGSSGTAAFAALEAALLPIQELGTKAIFAHVSSYEDELERGLLDRGFRSLRARDPELRSGILSVEPPADLRASGLNDGLFQRGVVTTNPDGLLRFAPHFPNHVREIPNVMGALDETMRELRALRSSR